MEVGKIVVCVDTSGLDELLEKIRNSLKLSESDIKVIRDINLLLKQPTPSVQTGIESRVSTIDSMRIDLVDLIYKVDSRRADFEYNYKIIYDREFTRLTKAERPSQASIEAEIHAMSEDMSSRRLTLDNYNILKSLLFGYLKSLDLSRETCMKKWGYT